MKIINLKKTDKKKAINQTVKVLKRGGLVIYPTETCYGIGADATNPKAVIKLLQYKGNRQGKAISVAVNNQQMAEKYVYLNQTAKNLYQNFLPGPLTIISKSKNKAVSELESEKNTLGIRIPDHKLILQLIKVLNKPITATSANTSNKPQPYSIKNLLKYTSKKSQKLIDLILDAGKLKPQPPSSVVDTTLNELKLIRKGEITIPQIKGQYYTSSSESETKKIARKLLKKHFKNLKTKSLIFALQGELGAGKTQFIKGLAQELGITTNVPSPTYILLREYPYSLKLKKEIKEKNTLKGTLFHIDTWRMENKQELLSLGLNKMLKPKNIIAIEWLEKVKPVLEEIAKGNFVKKNSSKTKSEVKIVWVTIDYLNQEKRKIKYQ